MRIVKVYFHWSLQSALDRKPQKHMTHISVLYCVHTSKNMRPLLTNKPHSLVFGFHSLRLCWLAPPKITSRLAPQSTSVCKFWTLPMIAATWHGVRPARSRPSKPWPLDTRAAISLAEPRTAAACTGDPKISISWCADISSYSPRFCS